MSFDIKRLIAEREAERYELHANHLNEQMVQVLKTIGFDKRYQRGIGQYLYDEQGERYLDLLSGWGVFVVGRNHPTVREALSAVLDRELPNLVQMGVSALSGVLAETCSNLCLISTKSSFPIPARKPLNLQSNLPARRPAAAVLFIAAMPFTV